jgi:PAS domain-containing protein
VNKAVTRIPDHLSLVPRTIVAGFPGSALLTDASGRVLAANAAAAELADRAAKGELPIAELAREAGGAGHPAQRDIDVERADGRVHLDVIALPLVHGSSTYVLVLGRESTLERNFIDALVSSRQFFKDLVSCSSDFAWETKPDGTFAFVSNRGAIGYSARDLFGRSATALRIAPPDGSEPGPFPFSSRDPLTDVEVWLTAADGAPACLLTSCVPVFDEQRAWLGARGVCRDVTEARRRDAALKRLRDREQLIGEIVDAIRTEVEPAEIFAAAVASSATTFRAHYCWIVRTFADGRFTRPQRSGGPGGEVPAALADAVAAQLGARPTTCSFVKATPPGTSLQDSRVTRAR